MNLQIHFVHRHMRDIIVIMWGLNISHLYCLGCYMFVHFKALNGRHPTMALCVRGYASKCCRLVAEEAQDGTEIAF